LDSVEPSVATKIFLYILSLLCIGAFSLVDYSENSLTHINYLKDGTVKLLAYV
jgi:hypothetical protein